ncbi:MAG: hypothetical protein Q8O72_09625 [Bacteroidales bacterium]|nr:hypothetical protein [Bacteroidales bacterium]
MRIFVSMLFIFISLQLSAQDIKTVRIEIPSDIDADSYHLEPVGKNGVLIFYASNEVDKEGKRNWYFGLFDEMLNQQWLKFVALNDHVEYLEAKLNGNRIHLLYRNTAKSKSGYDFYEIVTYDAKIQAFSLISGTIPEKAEISAFSVIYNTACLALNLRKNASDLVFISLISGEVTPVHLFDDSQCSIMNVDCDNENELFIVASKVVRDGRYLQDVIRYYSPKGDIKSELAIDNTETMKLMRNFRFFPKRGGELVVLGTYDMITGRMASLKDLDETDEAKSAGYFFLKFKGDVQTALNFYDFMQFSNIKGTMEAREIVNARSVKDSTGEREKHKVVMASFHLTQPLAIKANQQYILSTEVYKPYYQTETRMDYDYYGRPYPHTVTIFAGYQFYDILLASFSEEGNLLWDNEFVIDDILSFKLKRHAIIVPDSSLVTIGYINGGKLFSKTIEGPVTISKESSPVAPLFVRDRITRDDDNVIVPWFNNYYLIYGKETIRNRALANQDVRTVFYVNKVAFL